eukprot:1625715-Rhodomonas_salina.1
MKRNPPDSGIRKVRADPADPTSALVEKKVDVYVRTDRSEMKEWLVEVFSEPGYRPPMISHTLFDCIPEPHVADG